MMENALYPPTENASGDNLLLARLSHGDCCITKKGEDYYAVRADKVRASLVSYHTAFGTNWWLRDVCIDGLPYTAHYKLDNSVMQHAMAILRGKEADHD